MLKKYFFSLFCFVALFILPTTTFAMTDEEISSFHSEIIINQDTSLSISETIMYTTILQKHGIYRYIPITYNQGGRKEVLPIRDISVTNELGERVPFERSKNGAFLMLKIGDPDSTFTGERTYKISYQVDRGVRQFANHSELYWDITGEGWKVPIATSTASITSYFAKINTADCFSGLYGSNDGLCTQSFDELIAHFAYDQTITYGDNFTVLVMLPKESELIFPSETDLLMLWLRYNWPMLLVPLPLAVMLFWWYKAGRDIQFVSPNVFLLDEGQPTQAKPIQFKAREPFVYEPIKELTAGEAGALLDEKVDMQDVVAELLDMARKKYIAISEQKEKKLFGTKKIYVFQKLASGVGGLSPAQQILLDGLFASADTATTKSLKGTFYTTIAAAQTAMQNTLVAKKIYTKNPTTVRATAILLFFAGTFAVGFINGIVLSTIGIFWPLFLLALQAPIGFMLAYNMPQKTAVGTNLWLQARGLRKTIAYGKWREEIKEKNLFIEEILPFAVALRVVEKLSHDMQELNIKPPEYLSSTNLAGFTLSNWVHDFSEVTSTSLAYNPSSSSSSGGSGSSGGSSGGGGGGGGGGSW